MEGWRGCYELEESLFALHSGVLPYWIRIVDNGWGLIMELDPIGRAYIVGILVGFVFGYLLGKLRFIDEEV